VIRITPNSCNPWGARRATIGASFDLFQHAGMITLLAITAAAGLYALVDTFSLGAWVPPVLFRSGLLS